MVSRVIGWHPDGRVSSGVRWDRWVLPPAVCAAVFAVLAISPPVGHVAHATEVVEALGDPSPGRPWLLRTRSVADVDRNPATRVSVGGVRLAPLAEVSRSGRWYRAGVPTGARSVELRLEDPTGVHVRRIASRVPVAVAAVTAAEGLHVVEGVLVPELAGEVLVEAGVGAASVRLVPATEEVGVEPSEGVPDACGIARFVVRVSGLGAPVSLRVTRGAAVERHELRLPLVPGGVAVRDEGAVVTLRATNPGVLAHVVAGDESGPTWWSGARLAAASEEGVAAVRLPAGVAWLLASRDHDLSEPVSPLTRSPGAPCDATALGRRLAGARRSPPPLPPVRTVWDGPAESRRLTELRMNRSRGLCLAGLALSVALEVSLLLGAGLTRGPDALRAVSARGRERLGVLAAGASLLLLAGAAMGLAVLLRGP